jgi:N-ethylmaleimide reductase
MKKILTPYHKKGLHFKNHIVMAPMTRSRAIDNIPNDLMAEYYGQRSGAGLIVTEGTAPTPNALGYPRIPGIFSHEQIEGWKKITHTVHQRDSKIFIQFMHTGRVGHELNLPKGEHLVGPSNIKVSGQIYTDAKGMQDYSKPMALTTQGVIDLISRFVEAGNNAITAGFDGIELHAAHGYILEQFLNPHINNRTDEFGGSIPNRVKLIVEVTRQIANAIGPEKVGIRFSPFSTFNDMPTYDQEEVHQTYRLLAQKMNDIGIAYLHLSANPDIPQKTYDALRKNFTNTMILCNGLTPKTAEEALNAGFADLVAFARNFLANPDLVERIEKDAVLNEVDFATAYTPGPKGYTDYKTL